jgi:O-6-methylguanine DNA methyltransferase
MPVGWDLAVFGHGQRGHTVTRMVGSVIRQPMRERVDHNHRSTRKPSEVIRDVPTATNGTDFQREVWAALRRIPAGVTVSYGGLAATVGRPDAVRAVGSANGANPIAIVVPCHRVIGSDASLTGYGGGLERKRWLLAHEQRDCSGALAV